MNRSVKKKSGIHLGIVAILLSLVGGLFLAEGAPSAAERSPAKKDRPPVATVQIAKQPDLYAAEPPPLTVTQCGQCHPGVYQGIKNDGGRHTFHCQNCHKTFHSYNPNKGNWADIMPKCASCHTLPHGPSFTECAACHQNPHAAAKVPMSQKLLSSCAGCHAGPPEDLKKYPSKHSSLSCADCHTAHGLIPSCSMCHKPHYEGQDFKSCASECHPVHMPKQIRYTKDAGARTCGSCHDKVYATWSKSPSRHGKVNCAACHTKHGFIPQCTDCHGLPHSKQLHERFPKCLTCHQDPHNPPVRQR
ncbi:cytochrome c [Geobacter pickeringii]|uniref:Cytochrome C n=1 Tax=Geobacter pickeringii TaxID=345632 RepID=A0A0B5BBG6_9BACT|nr:cytochrome c [Geobacter pickeringii]AJE04123.1 cytochrome C [Geobacter pickeringii]